MKRLMARGVAGIMLLALTAAPAFASGDKIRGKNGQGGVNQIQVMDPPPFQP